MSETNVDRYAIRGVLVKPEEIKESIDDLFVKYEELMTEATHITQVIKPVVGGGSGAAGKIEPLVVQMLVVAEQIQVKMRCLMKAQEDRRAMIATISNENLRALVAAHYCDRKSYGDIAKDNGMRRESVCKAVARGVKQIKLQEVREHERFTTDRTGNSD